MGLLLTVIIFLVSIQPVYAKPHEEPLQRIVLTLLAPKIQEQINRYYKDKLTVSPTFSPFLGGTNLDVEYHPSHIDVHVKTIPYVGPHLDVGMDSMRFRIDNTGTVMVLEYKHIRDYELPPNWQHIIKTSFNLRVR
ncbi:DUF3888 domain-containing protein [Paenibacillus sp. LMG 31456]|uniref:DUF3888 domain-containing protein n=1 Tax=Paenibacillus foliorum TaxID=2654974 RepID=A0A972H7K3_9BACL|nr:DUF3888 domain-containing protein [Paenibacillus foliorum]